MNEKTKPQSNTQLGILREACMRPKDHMDIVSWFSVALLFAVFAVAAKLILS